MQLFTIAPGAYAFRTEEGYITLRLPVQTRQTVRAVNKLADATFIGMMLVAIA